MLQEIMIRDIQRIWKMILLYVSESVMHSLRNSWLMKKEL